MLLVILFYLIWELSSPLTHFTKTTDRITYDNDLQSQLPLLGFERGKTLYPLLPP